MEASKLTPTKNHGGEYKLQESFIVLGLTAHLINSGLLLLQMPIGFSLLTEGAVVDCALKQNGIISIIYCDNQIEGSKENFCTSTFPNQFLGKELLRLFGVLKFMDHPVFGDHLMNFCML